MIIRRPSVQLGELVSLEMVPDLHQAEVEYIPSRVIRGRPGDDRQR